MSDPPAPGFDGDCTNRAEITRADVADFILKVLVDGEYIWQTPGVSYSAAAVSN